MKPYLIEAGISLSVSVAVITVVGLLGWKRTRARYRKRFNF